ncbi:MAG TPA: sensor histidine kinase [Candidatus Acidoferrales bacterium]|nr:sensor histidine kinase [Candidatus Acidoferrales bacterium]
MTTPSAKPAKKNTTDFESQFRSSLSEYTTTHGEPALRQAYELGRRSMEEGKSLLDVVLLYHDTLGQLLARAKDLRQTTELFNSGADFLRETISPYEMAHRGYQDAIQALRGLNETLESEISRIAFAVHDDAGQLLVAANLALSDLSQDLPVTLRTRISRLEKMLEEVQNQLRRYSHELRPTILDELGWIPAIRFLAEGVQRRYGLPVEITATSNGRLPRTVETALYRVVQEALTNITKHARASRASIRVRREGRWVKCIIHDDGLGFDTAVLRSDRNRTGLGLLGMRERLNAIGGSLQIDSAPGKGAHLEIRVPVRTE